MNPNTNQTQANGPLQQPGQVVGPTAGYTVDSSSFFRSDYAGQPQPVTPAPSTANPSKSHRFRGVGMATGALLLFVAGYFTSSHLTGVANANAKNQAKSFIAALNQGDNTRAYAMASSALHSQQTESEFASSMGDLTASDPNMTSTELSVNGKTATYTATEGGLQPAADGSTTATFAVYMVKSGALGWKVDNVSVE